MGFSCQHYIYGTLYRSSACRYCK